MEPCRVCHGEKKVTEKISICPFHLGRVSPFDRPSEYRTIDSSSRCSCIGVLVPCFHCGGSGNEPTYK
jgi:hypothetical protein